MDKDDRHPLDPVEIKMARVGDVTYIHADDLDQLRIGEARRFDFESRMSRMMDTSFDDAMLDLKKAHVSSTISNAIEADPMTLDKMKEIIGQMPPAPPSPFADIFRMAGFHQIAPMVTDPPWDRARLFSYSYPLHVLPPGRSIFFNVGEGGMPMLTFEFAKGSPRALRAVRLFQKRPLDRRRRKRAMRILREEIKAGRI